MTRLAVILEPSGAMIPDGTGETMQADTHYRRWEGRLPFL